MRRKTRWVALGVVLLLILTCATAAWSQQNASSTTSSTGQLPRLVKFSGTLKDLSGNPLTGIVGVTFALYSEESGSAPLWLETQNVHLDKNGEYTVLLGSTKTEGLPMELFISEKALWLGVQPERQSEQPRVLLVSVPYALKASDADTVGGIPASSFMLANGSPGNESAMNLATAPALTNATKNAAAVSPAITGTGVVGYIPMWSTTTNFVDSVIFQKGSLIGIGTTTPATALDVKGAVNASTSFDIGGTPFAFGVYAKANAFLGFAGNATMTGAYNTASGVGALISDKTGGYNTASGHNALGLNTTGTYNTASGAGALKANTTASYNTAFGAGTLQANTTGFQNTANGYYALFSNISGSGNTASGYQALYYNTGTENTATGWQALYYNTTGTNNTASGAGALYGNTTGFNNTASGYGALDNNSSGYQNTASGTSALWFNTTGFNNTASGYGALYYNSTGSLLTCIGYDCDVSVNDLTNATAIGANAMVGESNALVLGSISGVNGATSSTRVGIGTTVPTNVLTIAKGAGLAVADGWSTYSSRRWKTNIQTLQGALATVEQLRGVSYDLKDNGKHEVGVIAEEVGAVVPEVVTWGENGKDAQSVDYGRLTALLIEATKEQQALIYEQQKEIKAQQAQLSKLTSEVKTLQVLLKSTGQGDTEVRTLKGERTTVSQE